MSFTIDEAFLRQVLSEMVQIDSSNPSLTPGSPGEAEIGAYVAKVFEQIGLNVTIHEVEPGRVNVVGILKGTGNGRSLILNGHLDTVSHEGMAEPLSGAVRDGKLYGRGSEDMKSGIAAIIAAAKALVDADITLGGDLLLTTVADEEYASIGTANIIKYYTADAAIITEPTAFTICQAHRGFMWYEIEMMGRAAHGSRYDEGVDAIMHMGRFLAELDKLEQELRQRSPHPLAGVPSLHASIIKGGTEISVYPASCVLEVERRTIPGETEAQVSKEFQDIIDKLSAADPTFNATVKQFLERSPFALYDDAEIIGFTQEACMKRLGKTVPQVGASYWTDAALLGDAGIDTILLGASGEGLHSAEEWVDVQSVIDLAYILADTTINFCK